MLWNHSHWTWAKMVRFWKTVAFTTFLTIIFQSAGRSTWTLYHRRQSLVNGIENASKSSGTAVSLYSGCIPLSNCSCHWNSLFATPLRFYVSDKLHAFVTAPAAAQESHITQVQYARTIQATEKMHFSREEFAFSPYICYIKMNASATERDRNVSRDCRARRKTPTKLRKQRAMAPGTWDKTVPPGVTHELLFPRGISCAPEQDGSLQVRESCLEPSAAAAIVFPVSSQVGGDQKEMVNLKRTWSRLLNHLCPPTLPQAIAEQQVDPSLAIAGAQGSGELFPLDGPQPIVPMACEQPGMGNWVSMPRTCFFSTSQGCHARPSGIDEGPLPHIFFALEGLCLRRHKAGFVCFGNGSIRAD